MDIIFAAAEWYMRTFDGFFAMIGLDTNTPAGMAVVLAAAVGFHFLGDWTGNMADRIGEEADHAREAAARRQIGERR